MKNFNARQIANNFIVTIDGKVETIVFPSGYNFDKLFSLSYKIKYQESKIAFQLLQKELNKYRKIKEKNPEIVNQRIERKKVRKTIKKIQSFDYESLPIYLPENWVEILKSKEENTHIKNFLLLLSLNKSEFTRNNFLKQFSGKYPYITDLGYLIGVRQVHKVEKNDVFYDFLHSSFIKVKGWKKSPKNYSVWNDVDDENKFQITKSIPDDSNTEESSWEYRGNLDELYSTYTPVKKSVYCSNYNLGKPQQESWEIGQVITIDDPKYADDEICGYGRIHIKSDPFSCIGNNDYGDVNIITITNPSKLLGIREDWKYTTSETYLACEITDEEIKETFKEDFGYFASDFANIDIEEVRQLASKNSKLEGDKYKKSQKELVKQLKDSLKIEKTVVSPEDFNKILKNRIQNI